MQALLATQGNAPLPSTMNAEEVQTMIGTEWQKVLFGQQTVDEAMASIEKQWKEIIAK
jgi:ABC-type glycerol-3-phosphate transport system substrate-binding protein